MAFKVGDEFRTSELSREPGGSTVVVVYHETSSKKIKKVEYDKIKNTYLYIKAALKNPEVKEAYVKN